MVSAQVNQAQADKNVCTLTAYDSYGRVLTQTDTMGRQTVTHYDGLGRVKAIIENWQDGVHNSNQPDRDVITQYEYDALGNTVLVTDTLGRMSRTDYNALNQVVAVVANWNGSANPCAYLQTATPVPPAPDENLCTLYAYDAVGNTIIVTDSLGRASRTFYDARNQVIATIENWQAATLSSPADCNLAPTRAGDENVCTLYGYDAAGKQITITNVLSQTSLTVYDAAGRAFLTVQNWDDSVVIDEAADCTFPPTRADVNVCALTTYDALGRVATTKDALGLVTRYHYDGVGRVITTNMGFGLQVTSQSYDALGNRLTTTDARGQTTQYHYDGLNRLVATTSAAGVVISQTYNGAEWVLTTTQRATRTTVSLVMRYTYDAQGQRVALTDGEGNRTQYGYDGIGNQVVMTDALGIVTQYTYDGVDRLTGVIENRDVVADPTPCEGGTPGVAEATKNVCTQYRYDALGNQTHITNGLGYRTTHIIYDSLNRPSQQRDALGNKTQTVYNALGLRTVMTDGKGAVTQYDYDGLNQLVSTTYVADGQTVQREYDALGNVLVMTDNVGVTTYAYDSLYRLLTVTNSFTATVGYGYDANGNRTQLIYPGGQVVTYTYDGDNRPTQVRDWQNRVTQYAYDPLGRLITTTLPNGVQSVYQYDQANRLVRLTHQEADGDLLADFYYALDRVGNRLAVTETLVHPLPPALQHLAEATTAEEVLAAVSSPRQLGKRVSAQAETSRRLPPTLGPAPAAPTVSSDEVALSQGEKRLPTAVIAAAEQARNQIEMPARGLPGLTRSTHAVAFDRGQVYFRPLGRTGVSTLTVQLVGFQVGTMTLPVRSRQPHIAGHTVRYTHTGTLVEQFVAQDEGVEQQWLLLERPQAAGGVVITVAIETSLTAVLAPDGEGVRFRDGTGVVAQYGRAKAIDAAGRVKMAQLTMTARSGGYWVEMRLPAAWLAEARYPLLIDPLLQSTVLPVHGDVLASTQEKAAAATDGNGYLVVWQDERQGTADIYGQFVAADGYLADSSFLIAGGSGEQTVPAVAYHAASEAYLVVWREGTSSIQGKIITATGSVGAATITVTTGVVDAPAISSQSWGWWVAWQADNGSVHDIRGRSVSASGTLGTAFTIDNSSNDAIQPVVAEDGGKGLLVVWSEAGDIVARRTTTTTVTGAPFVISNTTDTETAPAVVYNADDHEYMIAWQQLGTVDRVWLQTVSGVTQSNPFVGQAITVSHTLTGDHQGPTLSYVAGQYQVSWQRADGAVLLRAVTPETDALGTPFTVVSSQASQVAMAGNLLVWRDTRGGDADIYGRLLANTGGFASAAYKLHAVAGDQSEPQVAYNPDDGHYLVVWQDYRSGSHWDVYGQRIGSDGSLLGNNIAIITDTYDHDKPQVAYGHGRYLVVWRHYPGSSATDFDTYGQMISATGTLLGNRLPIATGTGSKGRYFPTDLVYNAQKNRFLTVLTERGTGQANISLGQVAMTGTVGPLVRVSQPVTYNYAVGKVAYNPDDNAYLAVWMTNRQQAVWPEVVLGQRVTMSNGQLFTNTAVITISAGTGSRTYPDVAYLKQAQQYAVVWRDWRAGESNEADIYGRLLSPSGVLQPEFGVAETAVREWPPRIEYDPSTGESLVVWSQDGPKDVYGRMLSAAGEPTGATFVGTSIPNGDQRDPVAAANQTGQYLLTWHNIREAQDDVYAGLFNPPHATHIHYTYDPLYRLTSAAYTGTISATYQYQYDAVGNMTAYTESIGVTNTRQISRTFNQANQLQTAFDPNEGTTSFAYDKVGNLVQTRPPGATWANSVRYGFNQRNLLITNTRYISGTGWTDQVRYVYDGANNRLQQIVYSNTTLITTTYTNDVYGLSQVLFSTNGNQTTYNLFGVDLLYSVESNEAHYLLVDGLGSVRMAVVKQVIKAVSTYTPYGATLFEAGKNDSYYRFTGEQYDLSSNLLYLRARYYSPQLQIFMKRDPWSGNIGYPKTLHGFAYVGNNPVNYVDPSGFHECTPEDAVISFSLCQPSLRTDKFYNYTVLPNRFDNGINAYVRVNYRQRPWRPYTTSKAPHGPALIPIRHPLNLLDKFSNCIVSLEEMQKTYTNGQFTVWEVNARNIMGAMASVISQNKGYAVRDAIGIAYVPYNRHQAGERGYQGKSDPLSLLLAGGDQFEVSANSETYPRGFVGPAIGSYTNGQRVYEVALIVAYGVHYEYFFDTSYKATEYRHRHKNSNSYLDCGYDGPAFFAHPDMPPGNLFWHKWPSLELELRAKLERDRGEQPNGWVPVEQMPTTPEGWLSEYPPAGCEKIGSF